MNDILRPLALWALVHETADEAWKAAVARGEAGDCPPEDALAALVNREKERLRRELAGGGQTNESPPELAVLAEEIKFELAQVRGRLESIETALKSLDERVSTPKS